MKAETAITGARDTLSCARPLLTDCGLFCDKACCKQIGDEPSGMLLFPGEAALYEKSSDRFALQNTKLVSSGESIKLLVCNGACDRAERPLACRLFPLFPYTDKSGAIKVKMDARAKAVCPLFEYGVTGLSKDFVRAVRNASRLLLENNVIRKYLYDVSRSIDDIDFLSILPPGY